MRFLFKLLVCCFCPLIVLEGCSASEKIQDYSVVFQEDFVPNYFVDHIKDKEDQINNAIQIATKDYASLIFFTDAHWGNNQKNSPALINHLCHYTPIDDVVFGGDVITTSFRDPQDALALGKDFRKAFDAVGCNMYYLYGNHDNNSDRHPTETEYHLSDEQVYDYLQKGMGECTYSGYFNFFFDRPESKTRFLCLDTGRYYYPQLRGNTIETMRFLINTLNETPSGWRIVLLSHLWVNLKDGEPCITSYIKKILRVLDNYNACGKGVFKYMDDSVEYDFSDASSKIICCIGGHCHLDTTMFSTGGIPIIITTTDSRRTINGQTATIGTVEEQAISVFVFDYVQKQIRMFRIGRGEDLYLLIND